MAQKTGQVLVRTLRDPRRAESPVISGKKEGYVRSCELIEIVFVVASVGARLCTSVPFVLN